MSIAQSAVTKVLIVGVGRIAKVHVEVLSNLSGVEIVAAVDINSNRLRKFQGSSVGGYSTIGEAIYDHHPDMVVVLTPTSTHVAVCSEVFSVSPGTPVLVEKPLATNELEMANLFELARRSGSHISVLYHMAFAPEVLWAKELVSAGRMQEHGSIVSFESRFADAYVTRSRRAERSLGTSWLDSGSNALSVLSQFVKLEGVVSMKHWADQFSTFSARIEFTGFTPGQIGEVFTTWDATAAAQVTTIHYENADLVLNHTSVTGWIAIDGTIVDYYSYEGRKSRQVSHYSNLYREWITGGFQAIDIVDTLELQALLLTM